MNLTTRVTINKNDFPDIAANMPMRCERIVTKTAHDLLAISTPLTPVDTGALRNETDVEDGATPTQKIVAWYVNYAAYQNMGTRRIPPKFFANRAAAEVFPAFVEALKAVAAGKVA